MICYKNSQGLDDIISAMGKVSYGLFSRSEDLLIEAREQYKKLVHEHISICSTLSDLCKNALRYCRNYRNLGCELIVQAAAGNHLQVLRALRDGSLGEVFSWDARATAW